VHLLVSEQYGNNVEKSFRKHFTEKQTSFTVFTETDIEAILTLLKTENIEQTKTKENF
jgi:hypothetical protein